MPPKKEPTSKPEEPATYGGLTNRLEYDSMMQAEKKKKQKRCEHFHVAWILLAIAMLLVLAACVWIGTR